MSSYKFDEENYPQDPLGILKRLIMHFDAILQSTDLTDTGKYSLLYYEYYDAKHAYSHLFYDAPRQEAKLDLMANPQYKCFRFLIKD